MRKSGAEILLRVRNLSVCRAFYRDVLALGAPATDGSFLCRFALAPDTFLTLVPIAESETAANAPWIFRPGDPELVRYNLNAYGYRIREIETAGRFAQEVLDPEQNPVHLME